MIHGKDRNEISCVASADSTKHYAAPESLCAEFPHGLLDFCTSIAVVCPRAVPSRISKIDTSERLKYGALRQQGEQNVRSARCHADRGKCRRSRRLQPRAKADAWPRSGIRDLVCFY